ncbi:MAG: AAA family ATPase [Chloroflexi bacterium]|nr:AAA family ATPase [Chloroflexota bacterium]
MVTTELTSPRITKVWAENFRSIENLNLDLDALTVLVGPNASGKSNIVDILRFVADATKNGLDSALTSRRGDHVARRTTSRRRHTDVTVGVSVVSGTSTVDYEFVVRLFKDARYEVIREEARLSFPESDENDLYIEIKKGVLSLPRSQRPKGMSLKDFDSITKRFRSSASDASVGSTVTNLDFPFRSFLAMFNLFDTDDGEESFRAHMSQIRAMGAASDFLKNMRFYHIFPDSLREPQLLSSKYPLQEHGENLASVLADMKGKKSPHMEELIKVLGQVVPGVKDVSVTRAGGHLVISIQHQEGNASGKGIWLDASQESDGTLRTLGLLAALFQDPTPAFITIEEPELTIHPGALSIIADLIVETSHRASLLVTTHSPELLDSLPIDSIRSVGAELGCTQVGPVALHQKTAVLEGLFSPGELHRIEGLESDIRQEAD